MVRGLFLAILTLVLLQSCTTAPTTVDAATEEEADAGVQIRVLSNAEVVSGARTPDSQRQLADLLYAGLQALDGDRLLTPEGDNAHDRFIEVLSYDSDNEIALQGLEDIVLRYVTLAEEASYQGLFEEAQQMLDRARFVDARHPAIEAAWQGIQAEMNSGDLFFELDYDEFRNRSEIAQEELINIAQQARRYEAFFLITAPNDDLARWMFSIMRGAVQGYRLRGNIELASRVTVRLRLPSD